MSLAVVTGDAGVATCTNDLGFTVELSRLQVVVEDLELTIEGETHLSSWRRLGELLLPSAHAHPGHYAGGEVTGELAGRFVLDLLALPGASLGDALLLPGDYQGMNFTFGIGAEGDGPEATELAGHTALLAGTASRGAETVDFTASIDVSAGTQMVGAPFELHVDASTTSTLALTARTLDPSEGDTLFDGLDFAALDADADGSVAIAPGDPAHNVLSKTLVRHDHWALLAQGEE